MADTSQQFTPAPRLLSYQSPFNSITAEKTSMPRAQVHYLGTDTITAIGAGDTKEIDVRFLQNSDTSLMGYAYRLRSLLVQINPSAGGNNDWTGKVLQITAKVNKEPSTGGTTMYWPLTTIGSGMIDEQSADWSLAKTYFVAMKSITSTRDPIAMNDMLTDPRDVVIYPEDATTRIQLINSTASVGPWTMRFRVVFDQYTIEQAENAAMYWLAPTSR